MQRVHLLGIPVDSLTSLQVNEYLRTLLQSKEQHQINTPNSEMMVASRSHPNFADVLKNGSLNIPDSIGIVWAAKWTGQHLPERITGVDTMQQLCSQLDASSPVFLLGAAEGIAEQVAEKLQRRNNNLVIAGTFAGSPREEDTQESIKRIKASKASVLFVAYGSPAQELWIAKHLADMPNIKVAMGVGGAFDFIAGKQRRAPQAFQQLGLEWLWRLMQEPKRIGRIWNAVFVFPLMVLRYGKQV